MQEIVKLDKWLRSRADDSGQWIKENSISRQLQFSVAVSRQSHEVDSCTVTLGGRASTFDHYSNLHTDSQWMPPP